MDTTDGRTDKRLKVSLSPEQYEWLRLQAYTQRLSMSEIVRGLVAEAMEGLPAIEPPIGPQAEVESDWSLEAMLDRAQIDPWDAMDLIRQAAADGKLEALMRFLNPSRGEGNKE